MSSLVQENDILKSSNIRGVNKSINNKEDYKKDYEKDYKKDYENMTLEEKLTLLDNTYAKMMHGFFGTNWKNINPRNL